MSECLIQMFSLVSWAMYKLNLELIIKTLVMKEKNKLSIDFVIGNI